MVAPRQPGDGIRRVSAEDLYWEEVEEARGRSLEEKFLAGPRLFDRSCEFMRAGIRMQYPNADEEEVERILLERLEMGRQLENRR